MVTVAMIAMMENNPTRKTLLKVTTSMMTTMTTVLHGDFQNDWSSVPFFSTAQSACIEGVLFGVAASSLIELYDRVLDSVVTPFFRSSYVIPDSQRYSVKFPYRYALSILLMVEAALHDCSASVLLRGIPVISCSFEFL